MKYVISIALLFSLSLHAQGIVSLFERIEESKAYQRQVHLRRASLEETKASLYQDVWSASVEGGYADVKEQNDGGTEFGVSIGKDFMLHISTNDLLLSFASKVAKTASDIDKNRLKARLLRLYGNYCITMDALQAKGELAYTYESISKQIDKGVEFGEFDDSKSIMAHLTYENLNLEISKLENELENYEAQIKSLIPFDGRFECQNIGIDIDKLFRKSDSLIGRWLTLRRKEAKAYLKRASSDIQTLNAQLSYADEFDTRRATIRVEIPFMFGSKKYESLKKAALERHSAVRFEEEAFMQAYKNDTDALKRRLKIYDKYVKNIEKSIRQASSRLVAQSKERFDAGEDSLIELLKATQTKLQMIDSILRLKLQRHNAVTHYIYKYAIDPQGVIR